MMNDFVLNFWTTLKRFRTSSILNIIGLAAAFAALYIIVVQVNYDLFYNHNIKDSERIYRLEFPSWFKEGNYTVWSNRVIPENSANGAASIEAYGCGNLGPYGDCSTVTNNQISHYALNVGGVSMGFLKVFDFESITGDVANIAKPKTVAISKSTSKKLGIGLGDNLYLSQSASDSSRMLVVAVFKDFPDNTDLSQFQVIYNIGEEQIANYGQWGYIYYVKLASGNTPEATEQQMISVWKEVLKGYGWSNSGIESCVKKGLRLVAIGDTYYKSDVEEGYDCKMGSKSTTYTLISVAVLVIAIAFINFINFFFALIPVRIRSINTRKVFGCSLFKLRSMLVFESVGLVSVALFFAAFIVMYAQNTRLAELISTSLSFGENGLIAVMVVVLALLLALFAGIYTAYYITSFPVAMSIKGSFGASNSGRRLRYTLVGFQFVISIVLIICAMFIRMQYNYMMNYDMGFNKECVLTSYVPGKISYKIETRNAFDSKLLSNPSIKEVAWGDGSLVSEIKVGWGRNYKDKNITFQSYSVSWNFLRFMGIKVVEGRDFCELDEQKETGAYIFNQMAKHDFNLTVDDKMDGEAKKIDNIVGICKNFNFKSLQFDIEPLAFYVYGTKMFRPSTQLFLRTTPNADVEAVAEYVKKQIADFDPNKFKDDIDLKFFDEDLQRNYEKEQNLSLLITLFSVLAIIISLMGVFGLVMFETQYRMKEIAVRRVHGASVTQVLGMFNRKFVRIVTVCFVVAVPVSYYLIHYWLGSYAYRMPIYWWVFAVALLIVLLITVVTVTVRSYSAATSNPAKMVKSE